MNIEEFNIKVKKAIIKKNEEQEIYCKKLKKAVLDGKTNMYGREQTDEKNFLFKQKILMLYAQGNGI